MPVNHRPRQHGRSKFGLERYARGGLDLLTVVILGRYQNRPAPPVRRPRTRPGVVGLAISLYLTGRSSSAASRSASDRCCFLGVLLIVVGIQLLSLGLLGQMLVLIRRER